MFKGTNQEVTQLLLQNTKVGLKHNKELLSDIKLEGNLKCWEGFLCTMRRGKTNGVRKRYEKSVIL